jgi:hypothetical protein
VPGRTDDRDRGSYHRDDGRTVDVGIVMAAAAAWS